MLLEALEILQSAGEDENTYVTDFALYKVIYILTVYGPIFMATFLLSQEYLGEKIACFPPENFTDSQADSVNEFCWNGGFCSSSAEELQALKQGVNVRTLFSQPHRYYPLYLPLQALVMMSPIIIWNVLTKSKLLAILRATEEFLEDLTSIVQDKDDKDTIKSRATSLIKQFHNTCISASEDTQLAKILMIRIGWEFCLIVGGIFLQFKVFNHNPKQFHCYLPMFIDEEITCTVPVLDLLDVIWSIAVACLVLALGLNLMFAYITMKMHFEMFQPLFFNSLPYGDQDDFNEDIQWSDNFIQHSYELLVMIFEENNAVMTKAFVLSAMKPPNQAVEQEKKVRKLLQSRKKIEQNNSANLTGPVEKRIFKTERHLQPRCTCRDNIKPTMDNRIMDNIDLAIFDPTLSSNTEENNIETVVKSQEDLLKKIEIISNKNRNDRIDKNSFNEYQVNFDDVEKKEENAKSLFDLSMEKEINNFESALDSRSNDPWGNNSGSNEKSDENPFEDDKFESETNSEFNPFATITEDSEPFNPFQTIREDDSKLSFNDFEHSMPIVKIGENVVETKRQTIIPLLPPPPKVSREPTISDDEETETMNDSESDAGQNIRENPFNKELSVDEQKYADFQSMIEAKHKITEKLQGTTSLKVEDEGEEEALAPFYIPYTGNGWKMLLRMPMKKKMTGNRYWKECFVKKRIVNNIPTVTIYEKENTQIICEIDLKPTYQLSDMNLEAFDQFGKCHTIKLYSVLYRERLGVKAERIAPTLGDIVRVKDLKGLKDLVHKPKTTMIFDQHAQNSELVKLGCLDYESIKTFSRQIEDEMMKLQPLETANRQSYTTNEITIEVIDEYFAQLDTENRIEFHKSRVRVFCLSFLNGDPYCEIGMNDRSRQGKEVVGRKDIIPIKTEEWINIEQMEFHVLVDLDEYEKTRLIKFKPMDAVRFELFRFRTRQQLNKELPLQVRVSLMITDEKAEMRCEAVVSQFWTMSRKANQTPCQDICIRLPIPDAWVYMFRVEKRKWNFHQSVGSVHSTIRKPGKIKGLERLSQLAQGLLEPSLIEVSCGQAKYENIFKALVWRIEQLPRINEGAYKQHLLTCTMDFGPHDIIPDSFDKQASVEYHQSDSCVSLAQVRSIGVSSQDTTDKWVKYTAKYEYRVEIDIDRKTNKSGLVEKLGTSSDEEGSDTDLK
ncbi:DgyrCDS7539 [Dimorphilus gyrociliatus]|uniref:Innexin n=1 Tax=Dimorphilus gyrociliatus TaxID=2664684 RepID=A0A7I8VSA8_9ANNE|nr:DgyrCDS7539 [Dimorphilus gyrociliatus]